MSYPKTGPVTLDVNLAHYAVTRALVTRNVTSDLVNLDFTGPKTANEGFKPMVRDGRFDVGDVLKCKPGALHRASIGCSIPGQGIGEKQSFCHAQKHPAIAAKREAAKSFRKIPMSGRTGIRRVRPETSIRDVRP